MALTIEQKGRIVTKLLYMTISEMLPTEGLSEAEFALECSNSNDFMQAVNFAINSEYRILRAADRRFEILLRGQDTVIKHQVEGQLTVNHKSIEDRLNCLQRLSAN